MHAIAAVFLCVSLLVSAVSAHAERRVAFVVGNGAYKHVAPLPNPPLDAKAMASLLRNASFEVVEGEDLSRDGMTAKLREFALKTQGADIALFFYAGHGISVNGKNYLIPVDADIKSEVDIKFGAAIDVDVALDQTMADAKVKLIFLDACRDNPFAARVRSAARTRSVVVGNGLAEMTSGEGTLIAFATGPGQTALDGNNGENSPFTRALIANIVIPGVEIQQAMTRVRAQVNDETRKQQLPWGHTNLIGVVYLNPSTTAAPADANANTAPATTVSVNAEVELEFWRSIKDSNKAEEFSAYLLKYPNGQFKSLALARIAALQSQKNTVTTSTTRSAPETPTVRELDISSAEASMATENELLLDVQGRRDIQKRLTLLGFPTSVDGAFGDSTRLALSRWQVARGYPKNGYLNQLQYQALLKENAATITGTTPAPREVTNGQSSKNPGTGAGEFVGGAVGGAVQGIGKIFRGN